MTDVLDGERESNCPKCGGTMSPPEYEYEDDGAKLIDGPGNYWCPICGYEDEE
jgi:hypothetical protein